MTPEHRRRTGRSEAPLGGSQTEVVETRPGIDIVVVSYHTQNDLKRFIDSYHRYQPDTVDTRLMISLVEATPLELEEALGWGHGVTHEPINVGYNRACNEAAAIFAADGPREVIGFFNADTELRAGVLETCYKHFQDPTIGVVGPRQVNRRNEITHAGIVGTHAAPKHRGWKLPDHGQFNDVIECVTVAGSAYLIRRAVFDELGACATFRQADPDAIGAWLTCQHYFSETWISYHCSAHGYHVLYAGDAPSMIHEWHQASPMGGIGEQNWNNDQAKFRAACDAHGLEHD